MKLCALLLGTLVIHSPASTRTEASLAPGPLHQSHPQSSLLCCKSPTLAVEDS